LSLYVNLMYGTPTYNVRYFHGRYFCNPLCLYSKLIFIILLKIYFVAQRIPRAEYFCLKVIGIMTSILLQIPQCRTSHLLFFLDYLIRLHNSVEVDLFFKRFLNTFFKLSITILSKKASFPVRAN